MILLFENPYHFTLSPARHCSRITSLLRPTQSKVNGEKVALCKRTKEAGKNEWFKPIVEQVFNADFACPEDKETCFFEPPTDLAAAEVKKADCQERWLSQFVSPFSILTGNLKKSNSILDVSFDISSAPVFLFSFGQRSFY